MNQLLADKLTNRIKDWAEYIDGGYVAEDVYRFFGFKLDYYSDYLIYECDITRVSLDGTYIFLANDHLDSKVTTLSGARIVRPHYSLASYDKDLYDLLVEQADMAVTNPSPDIAMTEHS